MMIICVLSHEQCYIEFFRWNLYAIFTVQKRFDSDGDCEWDFAFFRGSTLVCSDDLLSLIHQ